MMLTPTQKFLAGRSKGYNTEIHGVSDIITSKSVLSSMIGGVNIYGFKIDSDIVYCNIYEEYILSTESLQSSDITRWRDLSGKCTRVRVPALAADNGCFRNCTDLVEFTSENIQTYDTASFLNCTSLLSIKSVKTDVNVTYSSFQNCSSCIFDFNSLLIDSAATNVFKDCTNFSFENITISSSSTGIGASCFENTKGHADAPIFTNSSWTYIARDAFSGATGLTSVTFSALTSVGRTKCFYGMTDLTYFSAPNLVSSEAQAPGYPVLQVWGNLTSCDTLNLPKYKKTSYEDTSWSLFVNIKSTCDVWLDDYMETSNGGSEDEDAQYLIDRGCDVTFVDNS